MKTMLYSLLCLLMLAALPALATQLGSTQVELDGRRVSSEETNLGNFVTDAVRNAAKADIAVMHSMGFSANALIPVGAVDEQAMRGVLAFPSSKIVTVKMTPAQVRNLMVKALGKFPEPNMAFLQVSGMKVTFDSEKPAATRVTSIEVKGKALDFFDDTTTLTVAMPTELANGAVGYFSLFNEKAVRESKKTLEVTTIEAITKEFAAAKDGKIAPAKDGRLKDTAKEAEKK